jgi:hypothetical protein
VGSTIILQIRSQVVRLKKKVNFLAFLFLFIFIFLGALFAFWQLIQRKKKRAVICGRNPSSFFGLVGATKRPWIISGLLVNRHIDPSFRRCHWCIQNYMPLIMRPLHLAASTCMKCPFYFYYIKIGKEHCILLGFFFLFLLMSKWNKKVKAEANKTNRKKNK